MTHVVSKSTPRSHFHPENTSGSELHMAHQLRHCILEYLRDAKVSQLMFCELTSWSSTYADKIFENTEWDLPFSLRLAEHLHLTIQIIVHPPKNIRR